LGKHCVDVLYYYHSDHIGSSTFLTDAIGKPYQFMLYLPFGEAMAQQKVAGWSTPYTFTGKEQDAATGLHYYSLSRPQDGRARYLDTRLSIWFGVDPLADTPANIGYSSYHYVWNNPIKFIDPDGRHGESVDDTYGVNSKGEITKIDEKKYYDKDGNEVDMLVVGSKVKYNNKGEIKNTKIEVEKGRLQQATKERSISDGKNNYKYTYINFGENDNEANNLFTFLAENTDVEWAIFQKDKGYKKITELFSSHERDKEIVGASFLSRDPEGLIYHTHNHPRTFKMGDYSSLNPSSEDKSFAKGIRKTVPGAKFYIHFNYRKLSY
jgi:RHS repeat-associated protein